MRQARTQLPLTMRWRRMAAGVCAAFLLLLQGAHAAQAGMGEYQVKAAYLYNFISFTEWPQSVGGDIRLCVYGPDPFGSSLDALHGENVGGRTLVVARETTVDALTSCQVVFLSAEVVGNLPRVLDTLRGQVVLTVADSPGALHQGVGINMRDDADRIAFEVNLTAVHAQGLNLSFRLLRLAAEVVN